ncbi:MAG: type II toxin-antitoxin system VapC family toxin [Anaerolineae bacterium]
MSEPLTAFSGDTLYLDTTVLYALLRGIEPGARSLFARIETGELRAYTSVLTFDELTYRMFLALIHDRYGPSPLDRLRDQERQLIEELYPRLAPHLHQLRTFPNLNLVEVAPPDLEAMDEAMLTYYLRPRDALHLAAMQKCRCLDLVSHDPDFDHVPAVRRYTL